MINEQISAMRGYPLFTVLLTVTILSSFLSLICSMYAIRIRLGIEKEFRRLKEGADSINRAILCVKKEGDKYYWIITDKCKQTSEALVWKEITKELYENLILHNQTRQNSEEQ